MQKRNFNRRDFMSSSVIAGFGLLLGQSVLANNKIIEENTDNINPSFIKNDKRKLGSLEVSAQRLGGLPVVGFYGGGSRDPKEVNKLYGEAYEN